MMETREPRRGIRPCRNGTHYMLVEAGDRLLPGDVCTCGRVQVVPDMWAAGAVLGGRCGACFDPVDDHPNTETCIWDYGKHVPVSGFDAD